MPAIVWWPGKVKPGTTSDALVLGFDLFPTFTDIAGLTQHVPDNFDGISLKDHLIKQADVPDRDIFFGYEPKLGTAMRSGKWKMIIKGEEVQLYDLEADIKETTNIADQHPEQVKTMQKAIEQFKQTVTPGS